MKKFICLALTALLVLLILQPLQAADKPEKVRIGYLSLVNGQLLSKYLQLHEKELGVPVEWFRFNSGRDVNTAMASKSIDFGNVGLPPATIGLAGGMNYWARWNPWWRARTLTASRTWKAKPWWLPSAPPPTIC